MLEIYLHLSSRQALLMQQEYLLTSQRLLSQTALKRKHAVVVEFVTLQEAVHVSQNTLRRMEMLRLALSWIVVFALLVESARTQLWKQTQV
jgi:hypothetical protein